MRRCLLLVLSSLVLFACGTDNGDTTPADTADQLALDSRQPGDVVLMPDGSQPDTLGDGLVGPDGSDVVTDPDVDSDIDIGPPPELPDPPAEPLEIVQCKELTVTGNEECSAQAGSGAVLIQGNILGLETVWVGGDVLVKDGWIRCVGCDCSGEADADGATVVTCPDGLVSPGLINAHDHLTYTHNHPGDWGTERYEHRHDWRLGIRGHDEIPYKGGASNAQMTWGELRNVLAGTTSMAGSGQVGGFLRNLDKEAQEGLNQEPVFYSTFPLHDSDGDLIAEGCDYDGMDGTWTLGYDCYLPHVAEGIDKETRNEFLCLSSTENGGVDLTEPNAAFVHSIGMLGVDGQELAENGTAVIWSPRSNIGLYGHTAQVNMYDWQGVLIGIGTDWTASGSMNLLRELQCAGFYNDTYLNGHFTAHELWLMGTTWNAMALAIDDVVGTLLPNRAADIAIFRGTGSTDYHADLLDSGAADTLLVLRSGIPLYGATNVVAALPGGGTSDCEAIPDGVCGEERSVCTQREVKKGFAALAADNASNYPLFFCGEPDDEPPCVPFRDEPKGGTFDGQSVPGDVDGDGVANEADNCPDHFNPIRPVDGNKQADGDNDGIGDACDPCPTLADSFECVVPDPYDEDGDGIHNVLDNCPFVANPEQTDTDADGTGDECDDCPAVANTGTQGCPATIYEVKTLAYDFGARVEVEGVVTAVASPRFFIQVPEAFHDAGLGYEYSGLYVYISTGNNEGITVPQRGDFVRVSGEITDWYNQIELTQVTGVELVESNVELPMPVVASPEELGTGGELAEALEGVLVMTAGNVTELDPPAGGGDSDPTGEFVLDDSLRVNDFMYLTEPFPQVGDPLTVRGILRFANDDSKLEPRDAADIIPPLELAPFDPAVVYVNEGAAETGTNPPLVVRLTAPAPAGGATVTLESSDPDSLLVAASVVIPAGATEAEVLVTPLAATAQPAVITATFDGLDATADVFVLGAEAVPAPIALDPDPVNVSVDGVAAVTLTIDLPGRPGGTTVTLAAGDDQLITVPPTVVVPEDAFDVTFEIAGLAPGQTTVTASTSAGDVTAQVEVLEIPLLGLVLSEVYYDHPSGDDGYEWVELFNGTASTVDLSGYALGMGGTDYTVSVVQLAGVLEPGQCFVVGGPTAVAENGNPVFDQAVNFDPDFQNAGSAADAVALFAVPADSITASTVPIDAVIYGSPNSSGLMDETGAVGEPDAPDASSGNSLERTADGWVAQPAPTPNDCGALL